MCKFYAYRAVLWEMSLKKLKAKYSGSFLGIWWALLLPIILAAAINLVFSQVFERAQDRFSLFLLSGLLPWFFFSNSLNDAVGSFTGNVSEVRQNIFPREIIPLSYTIADFMNFMVGLLALLPLFLVFAPGSIALLPLLLFILILFFIFTAGIGLLFSSLNVFFRDFAHIMQVGMMIWFWLTPVFYSIERFSEPLNRLARLNPVVPYIVSFQKILFKGVAPSVPEISFCFIFAFFFFFAGYALFLKNEPEIYTANDLKKKNV